MKQATFTPLSVAKILQPKEKKKKKPTQPRQLAIPTNVNVSALGSSPKRQAVFPIPYKKGRTSSDVKYFSCFGGSSGLFCWGSSGPPLARPVSHLWQVNSSHLWASSP
jgi:hypothetical protein